MIETLAPSTPDQLSDVLDSWNQPRHIDQLRAFVTGKLVSNPELLEEI